MSTTIARYSFPSVTRVAIAWLAGQFGPGAVGGRRPNAAALPYRMVTLATGTETVTKTLRCGTVTVRTFASSYDAAESESDLSHQRMVTLGPPLFAPQRVTIINGDASTQVVEPRSVVCTQIPIWVDYEDDLIFQFVGRYEIYLGPARNS